jgi:hypothetical protein
MAPVALPAQDREQDAVPHGPVCGFGVRYAGDLNVKELRAGKRVGWLELSFLD